MTDSGAELMVKTLAAHECSHVFGNPGTTELPFIREITESEISYITCLHEAVAMGAAAGYAIRARQCGVDRPFAVANVHTTPGVAHALGNLYGASFGRVPVILTAGCQELRHERRHPPLSGDRLSLVNDFVSYAKRIDSPDQMAISLADAIHSALTPPLGPAYLEFSIHAQEERTEASVPTVGTIPDVPSPRWDNIEQVRSRLADESVTIVVGTELAQAGSDAIRATVALADQLDAAVISEPLNAELAFPTSHERWRGMMPLDPEDAQAWLDTSLIVFIGCTNPEPLLDYDGQLWPRDATTIWIGAHEELIPATHAFSVTLSGALTESLQILSQTNGQSVIADGGQMRPPQGIRPIDDRSAQNQIVDSLSDAASEAVIVDEGVTTGFLLRNEGVIHPGRYISNNSGGLGYGLPAAVGAAIAEGTVSPTPRPVVGLIGDGAYQYYPQSLYTAANHVTSSLTIVVPDNRGYGILREHDLVDEDTHDDKPLTFDERTSIGANARSYGIDAWDVTDLSDLGSVLETAIAAEGTDVVVVDITNAG